MKKSTPLIRIRRREKGFTLLEYCAGAAVIAGVVWIAIGGFGDSLQLMFSNLEGWVTDRASDIDYTAPGD